MTVTASTTPAVAAPAAPAARPERVAIDLTDQAAEVEAMLKMFNDAKKAIDAHQAIKGLAENRLRELLNGADDGVIDGKRRVKRVHSNNSHFDRKALKAGWPEAFQATLVQTPYDYIVGE